MRQGPHRQRAGAPACLEGRPAVRRARMHRMRLQGGGATPRPGRASERTSEEADNMRLFYEGFVDAIEAETLAPLEGCA
jgi:hypothetical protein